MRILLKAGNSPSPCDDNFEGEVEDYEISIAPGAPQQSLATSSQTGLISDIQVYPNPVEGILNLRVDNFESGDRYSIYNSNGEIVISDIITSSLTNIDLSGIATGLYFMAINRNDEVQYEKVIKR
jgi:hypothetical protein